MCRCVAGCEDGAWIAGSSPFAMLRPVSARIQLGCRRSSTPLIESKHLRESYTNAILHTISMTLSFSVS